MGTKIHKKLLVVLLGFGAILLGQFWNVTPANASPGSISATDIKNASFKLLQVDSSNALNNVVQGTFGSTTVKFSGTGSGIEGWALGKIGDQVSPAGPFCTDGKNQTFSENMLYLSLQTDKNGNYTLQGHLGGGSTTSNCQQILISKSLKYTPAPPPGKGSEFTSDTVKDLKASNFKFDGDGSSIVLNFNGAGVTFVDSHPEDGDFNFAGNKSYEFCSEDSSHHYGTIDLVNTSNTNTNFSPLAGDGIPFRFSYYYYDSTNGNHCTAGVFSDKFTSKIANPTAGNGKIATHVFSWDTGSDQINNVTATFGPLLPQPNDKTGKIYEQKDDACAGGDLILLSSNHGNTGTYYHGSGDVAAPGFNNCKFSFKRTVVVTGTAVKNGGDGGGDDGGGQGAALDCQTAAATKNVAGYTLSFVICPMLDAAQSFSDWLIGEVENLLSFTFQHNLGNSTQRGNVQNAWSQIRDLSSVFLVIIMLVMILSQAISYGPFDAYTIRKVMPRLVIAVIAMQLSWSLLEYVTRLFDAFGHGIADLMYQPFGGPSNLQLGKILQSAGIPAYAGGSVVLASLLAIGTIAVLSLPTILLIGWSIVMALLVAFVTLAVRQILIITMVILSPLAILLWILPNTQRYWKLWYDNFTKLLLMFPMIIGMIAAGRIFAYITSSGNNNTLIKFMLILIGYFGPFFMLPKTYKWGGQALTAAGSAINNAAPKVGGPVTNYLKGEQSRSRWTLSRKRRQEQLMRNAQARWAGGMSAGGPRGYLNRARGAGLASVAGGRLTPWGRTDRQVRQRIARGAEQEREKALKEQAQESLTHWMSQDAFRNGDYRPILHEMGINGTEHEQEALIGKLLNSRNRIALEELFNQRGTTHTNDPAYLRTINKDESGGLGRAAGDLGMSPY